MTRVVTQPFYWYQVNGHQSASNIKVTVFKKLAVMGAQMFYKHSLFDLEFWLKFYEAQSHLRNFWSYCFDMLHICGTIIQNSMRNPVTLACI